MERYEILSNLTIYNPPDVPVVVADGRLLRDHLNDNLLLQLKLQNTGCQSIRSVIFDIQVSNGDEGSPFPVTEGVYRNVYVSPGEFFGESKAIILPGSDITPIQIKLRAVFFTNSTQWISSQATDSLLAEVNASPAASTPPVTNDTLIKTHDKQPDKNLTDKKRKRSFSHAIQLPVGKRSFLQIFWLVLLIIILVLAALFLFLLHNSRASAENTSSDSNGVPGVSLSDLSAARYDNLVTGSWNTDEISMSDITYTDSATCSMFSARLLSGGTGFLEMNGVNYEMRWGYYSTQDNMIYYSATINKEKCVMGYCTDRDSPYYHHLIITVDDDTSLVLSKS